MYPVRAAFVLEQTLGHVTHSQNLHTALQQQSDVEATWLPIQFEVTGAGRVIPLLRNNWSVRASWRARAALRTALVRKPHDALVFHTQVTSLFSVDLMRRYPTIVSLDATPINYDSVGDAYGHRAADGGFLDRQKYQLNSRAFRAAHTLIAWSEWARQSLIHDYGADPSAIHVLAPGAHQTYFDIGQRRADHSRKPGPTRLLFVGGDFARKGGPSLVDAVRGLPNCELHVVTTQAIDTHDAVNVRVYRGVGPNSQALFQLFDDADVFVLPTRADCLAVVLMEATAAGLPVITTNVGALSEAVLPGTSGHLVPVGHTRSLRGVLESLIADPAARERMGRAGHALACHKFDARRNNATFLNLVRTAAETDRPLRRTA